MHLNTYAMPSLLILKLKTIFSDVILLWETTKMTVGIMCAPLLLRCIIPPVRAGRQLHTSRINCEVLVWCQL
jgi:hypothetical protein